VTGPDGKPLADAWVSAHPDMLSMLDSMRGAPGRQHRAEPCILIVMRPPRPFTMRGRRLEAGKTLDLKTITVDSPAAGSGSPPRP